MPFLSALGLTAGTYYMAAATVNDVIVAVAVPLNTLLLLLIGYYSRQHGAKIVQKIDAVQATATHSAQAAASAATVAADAARITKELGGILRADGPVTLGGTGQPSSPAPGGADS